MLVFFFIFVSFQGLYLSYLAPVKFFVCSAGIDLIWDLSKWCRRRGPLGGCLWCFLNVFGRVFTVLAEVLFKLLISRITNPC